MSTDENDVSAESSASLAELLSKDLISAEIPASTRHSVQAAISSSYLSYLTDLPLDTLLSEPTTLSSTSAQLTNALTTLCHTSYPTFLSLHTTSKTLSGTLDSLNDSLSSLISTALPALESSARSFGEESKGILSERRKANLVLEQFDKLRDLLEVPALVESCVRNGYFQEALDLSSHVTALYRRFPSTPIIADVKAEVDGAIRSMLAHLLSTLREQAKLPALFKAVSFLRKMRVLEEDELALAFLSGRLEYLGGAFEGVETEKKGFVDGQDRDKERVRETHARYLRKYVDVWREGVYDLITQYTTIFLDRQPSSLCSPETLHTLLSTLTTSLLDRLLVTLRTNLTYVRADPSTLSSLLTQLTYCATSFGRVGMDFKAYLAPIFEMQVREGVRDGVGEAMRGFVDGLNANPSDLVVTQTNLPVPDVDFDLTKHPPHVPPQILSSYPLFAKYLNGLLTTLNGLRLLAPVELLPDLVHITDESLTESSRVLLEYAGSRSQQQNEKEGEAEIVEKAKKVWVKVFVPFVRRALVEGVYGEKVEGWEPREELGDLLRRIGGGGEGEGEEKNGGEGEDTQAQPE